MNLSAAVPVKAFDVPVDVGTACILVFFILVCGLIMITGTRNFLSFMQNPTQPLEVDEHELCHVNALLLLPGQVNS